MILFTWLAGVLSDPNDKQGSTKRVVMFIFISTFMVLFSGVVIAAGWKFPDIPETVIALVVAILGAMGFLVTLDKGIAAYKEVNSPCNETKGATDASSPPQ